MKAPQEIRDEIVAKCSVVLRVDYPLPDEIAEEHESAEILAEKLAHFDYSDASAEEVRIDKSKSKKQTAVRYDNPTLNTNATPLLSLRRTSFR